MEESSLYMKEYPCEQCEKQFSRKHHLKQHVQSIHEGVKYSCIDCEKQFTHKGHLKKHIQSAIKE